MPMAFKSALLGPVSCTQLRAVICGGIIIGIMKQNTNAALARISVSATKKAKAPPIKREIIVPRPAV